MSWSYVCLSSLRVLHGLHFNEKFLLEMIRSCMRNATLVGQGGGDRTQPSKFCVLRQGLTLYPLAWNSLCGGGSPASTSRTGVTEIMSRPTPTLGKHDLESTPSLTRWWLISQPQVLPSVCPKLAVTSQPCVS